MRINRQVYTLELQSRWARKTIFLPSAGRARGFNRDNDDGGRVGTDGYRLRSLSLYCLALDGVRT